MNNRLLHTPDGVRDSYGDDYEKRLKLQLSLHDVLKDFGYRDISTPSFEYFDIFANEIGTTPSNELYKFFDSDNNTLVLRPDFTPGVARAAAKYFLDQEEVVKLSYMGNVFSDNGDYKGRLKERSEIGAEFMGDGSVKADAEMIKLASDLLSKAGFKDYMICIGNAEYFKGLCNEAGITGKAELDLREAISNRNLSAAHDILDAISCDVSLKEAIAGCIDYFGDVSILEKAGETAIGDRSKKAVKRLEEVYSRISEFGIEERVTFDLGMLSKYNYYTGIIFRAYVPSAGDAVIKGGRYDDLLGSFGKDCPAVGLTLSLDGVLQSLSREDARAGKEHYLTFALTKGRLAFKTLDLLEKIGISCEEMRDKDTRKLIFVNEEKKLKFFLAKGPDVPTYVEYGAADIGVVGKDTIVEEDRKIYEVLDLGFGQCRMCICGFEDANELLQHRQMIRVATKYPKITRDYFQNRKQQTVDIIKLNGSIELAPIVGLSDVICDIVETGSTLKENGLKILEEVMPLSARMVVNPVSMRLEAARIREIINALRNPIN
ncbi:MAG: ATP phosphoribosyltransferase regulatory subunit [Lachnospiraceae bacterium]|nr:ATP phosphoribosyltransferase regulatory subunit [Lachnospiraceae bacterium]